MFKKKVVKGAARRKRAYDEGADDVGETPVTGGSSVGESETGVLTGNKIDIPPPQQTDSSFELENDSGRNAGRHSPGESLSGAELAGLTPVGKSTSPENVPTPTSGFLSAKLERLRRFEKLNIQAVDTEAVVVEDTEIVEPSSVPVQASARTFLPTVRMFRDSPAPVDPAQEYSDDDELMAAPAPEKNTQDEDFDMANTDELADPDVDTEMYDLELDLEGGLPPESAPVPAPRVTLTELANQLLDSVAALDRTIGDNERELVRLDEEIDQIAHQRRQVLAEM